MLHEGTRTSRPLTQRKSSIHREREKPTTQMATMMTQMRRLMGATRVTASALPRRGIEEFFPVQSVVGEAAKADNLSKVPGTVAQRKVVTGGDWKAWMLRQKSTEDLHKLWYVLLKERNALLTERAHARAKNVAMPNPERRTKVQKSMARIKLVLHERSTIYQANKAAKAGAETQQQQ